ncbi:MAG: signal recognition particle-docking protein FtsY [Desulfobacterales bacterium]
MSWFRRNKEDPSAPPPAPKPVPDSAPADESPPPRRHFARLRERLAKTRQNLSAGFSRVLTGKRRVDAELLEEIEELLITSDVGVRTAARLIERLSAAKAGTVEELQAALREEILAILTHPPRPARPPGSPPHVIMVVGVNGVGKTTTIGKLAARLKAQDRKVLIAAADTFRAAAVEQLTIWAERAGADIVRHQDGADPAAVAYDAVDAARARGADVVIVDTAGRLHTKVNLMEEIKKVKRSIAKKLPDAPHEILLVLDATTGQNAISQARLFHEALELTGIALTKLDGTAKGGIVIAICHEFDIPLRYIGIGEGIEDLQDFDPEPFVEALFAAGPAAAPESGIGANAEG